MPKRYKANACLTLVLAVVFYLFWQVCKQQLALARVATFTDDPYDAVGSFATQFALFTALLTMIRAFRPYQSDAIGEGQQVLFARGVYFTCLAVAVTLGVDVVAMLRYPSVWIGSAAGYVLAVLVVGMALLTALVGWSIHRADRNSESKVPSAHRGWVIATGISLVGAIICALYPENWRQYVSVGEMRPITASIVASNTKFTPLRHKKLRCGKRWSRLMKGALVFQFYLPCRV